MNKKLAFLAAPLIMLAASTTVKADSNCDFRPYIGADAQIRHMPFKKGYGNLPLDSNYPQGNVFVGAQINRYVGIELGYESSFKKSKIKNLAGTNSNDPLQIEFIANQDSIFGNFLDVSAIGLFPITVAAKNKITGWNLNVTGTLPICEAECLDLIAAVGFSRIRTRVEMALPQIGGGPNNLSPSSANYFKFSHPYKTIPRLMIGLQKMMTCHAGIRFTVGWEPTSKLNDLKLYQQPDALFYTQAGITPVFTARLNDSINYGIGLFWRF